MGLLIVLGDVTKGMREVADNSGIYTQPDTQTDYPRIQIVTVSDLLARKRPRLPEVVLPYVKAKQVDGEQLGLL